MGSAAVCRCAADYYGSLFSKLLCSALCSVYAQHTILQRQSLWSTDKILYATFIEVHMARVHVQALVCSDFECGAASLPGTCKGAEPMLFPERTDLSGTQMFLNTRHSRGMQYRRMVQEAW